MLHPDYPLESDRLTLRPFQAADLDALYSIHSLPEVAQYVFWYARSRHEVEEALASRMCETALKDEGDCLSMAVVLRETGALIGSVNLWWLSRRDRCGEIGYMLHPDFQGRGFATEAGRVLLGLGFDELGLHRMIGRLDRRNVASARVLERLGMRLEAHFVQHELIKGEWVDQLVYALLEHEWQADPKAGDA